MSGFVIDPERYSFSDALEHLDPCLQQVSYCGIEVPGLTVYAPRLSLMTEKELAAQWLAEHLAEMSAHARLALIQQLLNAEIGPQVCANYCRQTSAVAHVASTSTMPKADA